MHRQTLISLPRFLTSLLLFAALLPAVAIAQIYVDHAATGANDGSDWDNAFTDLQAALASAAGGDEIWVAAGIYKPTDDSSDRDASFTLINGVAIYGGFAGDESALSQRDWLANLTVLSGDIDGNDNSDANGVVLSAEDVVGANSFNVTIGSNTNSSAILDGFTITAGRANGPTGTTGTRAQGGGMYIFNGSPTLTNLRFRGNQAQNNAGGGGLITVGGGSNPSLSKVEFSGNRAGSGGGMQNVLGSPVLTSVSFNGNQAATGNGGGLESQLNEPVLTNVSFSGNRAAGVGGGLSFSTESFAPLNVLLRNAIFWNNQDSTGIGTASASYRPNAFTTVNTSYSLVQGCNPGGVWTPACGNNGGNNLDDADPRFVNTPDPANVPSSAGNLRLQARSPAVDAGNDALFGDIDNATDLDGQARRFGPSVDLGPYESTYLSISLSTTGSASGSAAVLSPLPARFDAGETVTVEAVPDANSEFDAWSGDIASVDNPLIFIIDSDTDLIASFLLMDEIFHDRFVQKAPD